eukprot:585887-Prorocentrum_minimum.AAC.1
MRGCGGTYLRGAWREHTTAVRRSEASSDREETTRPACRTANQSERIGNIRERPPIRVSASGISANDRQSE